MPKDCSSEQALFDNDNTMQHLRQDEPLNDIDFCSWQCKRALFENEKAMSNSPGYAIASQRPKGVWICNHISATQISRRPSVCLLPSPHVSTLRPARKSLIFRLMLLSKLDYSDTGQGQKKTNQSRPYMQLHFSGLCSYRRSHPGIMHKQENLLSKLKVGSASAKNSRIPAFRLDILQEERNAGNGSLSYKSPRGISDLSFLRHFRPN